MKTNTLRTLLSGALLALFCLTAVQPALADDTDIYINNTSTGSEPLVMFTLDWRSNLGSTICNFSTSTTDYSGIASACGTVSNGWTASFVENYFTASDLSDQKITFFELLRAVLRETMAPLDGVKVGLMLDHNQTCKPNVSGPTASGCSNGAYILSGFKSMDASDSNGNKASFYNLLSSIPEPGGSSAHPFQGKELYFELFRYLTGQEVYNGHLGWEDFGNTNTSNNLDGEPTLESPDYSAISWDALGTENIETDSTTGKALLDSSGNPIDILDGNGHPTYVSPLTSGMTCAKIYVINIMFQVSQNEDDSDSAISASKANEGMNGLVLSGKTSGFDTVINWMYKNDLADGTYGTAPDISGNQNVTSYFLTNKVDTTTNGYATAGGTGNAIALGSDPASLANTFKNLFSQILSVSTTFVSASVPVNVFNRADYLNDVYLALFQADQNANPFWTGNLKKLMLQQDSTGAWYIGDVNGKPAFAADGRINYDALTFWTDPTGWDVLKADPTKNEISGYDGRSVDRGGAGEQMPGFLSGSVGLQNSDSGARQVFTEPSSYTNGTDATLMPLDATTTNASNLWNELNANGIDSSGTTPNNTTWSSATSYSTASSSDQTEAFNILKWARGMDALDANSNGSTIDTRPWMMADPIHSTPLTINYGANASGYSVNNPDVRIIITGNDGFVHMVQNTDNTGAESGKEDWAFIPRYGLRILDRLMHDGLDSTSVLHPYGVDGAPVAYVYDKNHDGNIIPADGDKVILYFGMRRGGRAYYALDITNPDDPKMLWSINNNTTNFSQLGLTFSTPKVANMSYAIGGVTYTNQPVLIFGGGYDTNKDKRTNSDGTDDSMGNAIFIVNALNGSLVWKAVQGTTTGPSGNPAIYDNQELTDSIPSNVTALDSNGDGNIDRLYVGDTGGQVFRADLAGTDRSKWTLHVFASIGRHDQNGKNNDRRFFHAPDVVQTRDSNGPYDAVLIGSGDRANPLDESIGSKIPVNYFYMFKDRDTTSGTTSFVTPLYTMSSSTSTSTSISNAQLADLTNDCMQTGSCSSTTQAALNSYGWEMQMVQAVGEKVLSRPITINGVVYFTTYLPPDTTSTGTCSPSEGTGLKYAVNLQDATAAYNWDLTNSTTDATGNIIDLGSTDRFSPTGVGIPSDIISIRKSGSIQVLTPGDNYLLQVKGNTGYKTFWYTENE